MYKFRVKNWSTIMSKKNDEKFMINKNFKIFLNATQLQMKQKTTNVMLFNNVKTKLYYNKHHKLLLFKKNKIYFKLYKDYKLFENFNKKFSNQRCDLFLIKRQID